MLDLRRLKPSALTIAGLVGFIWAASNGAVRDFVWADLREGMMSLRGLTRATRWLARLGFVLLGVMVCAMVFNDLWRSESELIVMSASSALRGQLVPVALLPLTLFMFVMAWSFALTGALHSHWALRLLVLGLYSVTAVGWAGAILTYRGGVALDRWIVIAALAGVALVFAVRWRREARPALEFALIFLLVAAVYWMAQRQELANQAVYGVPVGLAKINFNVNLLGGLVTPLLLLIGVDIAGFTLHAAQWAQEIVSQRTPAFVLRVSLASLFGWRLWVAAGEFTEYGAKLTAGEQAWAYAGAFGEVALAGIVVLGLLWLARGRGEISREHVSEVAKGAAFPLVLAYGVVALLIFVMLAFAMALPSKGWLGEVQQAAMPASDFLSKKVMPTWHYVLCAAAAVSAVALARRGRIALALFLGLFAVLELWNRLARPGEFFATLDWRGQGPVEFWWLALITAALAWRTVRAQLTPERAGQFLFLLLVVTLMRQRDFIENPFTPFFGFAGVAFIAFALVWDMATRGSWANEETKFLPRISRIFLYVGYALLAATVLNWAVTTHDLDSVQKLTGGAALTGFDRFGKPILYAVFFLTLLAPSAKSAESAATA